MRYLFSVLMIGCLVLTSGCGQDLPENAAGESGGVIISKKEVESWMPFFAQSPGQKRKNVPDPPLFKKCAAGIKKSLPQSLKQRQEACRRGYISLRKKAMRWVLNQRELIGLARERGFLQPLELSINAQLANLDSNKQFLQQLKLLSLSQSMARDRILVNRITNRIRKDATESVQKPTRSEVYSYKERYKIKSYQDASAQLYQERVDQSISREFLSIEKRLREKTVCAPDFKVSLCS